MARVSVFFPRRIQVWRGGAVARVSVFPKESKSDFILRGEGKGGLAGIQI